MESWSGILFSRPKKPFSAKGSEPKREGKTAKVRPPSLIKFFQYRLLSERESRKGVKFPRYAPLLVKALPRPSTKIITILGLFPSGLKKGESTSPAPASCKKG